MGLLIAPILSPRRYSSFPGKKARNRESDTRGHSSEAEGSSLVQSKGELDGEEEEEEEEKEEEEE